MIFKKPENASNNASELRKKTKQSFLAKFFAKIIEKYGWIHDFNQFFDEE